MGDNNDFLTGVEAAEYLNVKPSLIYRLRANGDIGQLVMGKFWMYTKQELDLYRNTRMGKRGRPKGYSPKKKKEQESQKES